MVDAGHHQPAAAQGFTAGASVVAMPMSGHCYGAAVPSQQGHTSYMGLTTSSVSSVALKIDDGQERSTNKRKRDQQSSVLSVAEVQQQSIVVGPNLRNHEAKMWTTLREQRHRHINRMIPSIEARAAKEIKAKDQEIEWTRSMNWAREARIKNLYMEAHAWRNIAQSNEIMPNVLRADLQQVLEQQADRGGVSDDGVEDARSCSWKKKHVAFGREEEEADETSVVETLVAEVKICKGCSQSAPVVLLLSCRHLCICARCAEAARVCPSCKRVKTGSIIVNFL
ncbi:hypothetical protein ZWY2020_016135 [Hordeum vulgare]|nr:hypothetical protein ZWY2020_016135 [Hordeum vulgare]